MRNFRNYEVWQNSKELVILLYQLTMNFPDTEKFGLISQIRRAAVSIPANIAEGAGRRTEKDFRSFLYVSLGSAFELETLIELSFDLGFIDKDNYNGITEKINHVQRQLNSFIQRLN
jgi:four helix bundle protein